MLQVQNISLTQFRNYVQQSFTFQEKVVAICGLNGSGKTNLLDAIYYLGFTKSYFSRTDSQNVHHGLQGLRLQGSLLLNEQAQEVVCIVRENNKKEFSVDGDLYQKFSDHIGKYPCVMIAPDDVSLIIGASEERRKFIDTLLSQTNHEYLLRLIAYNKLLLQRNSLLKQAAEQGRLDSALLAIFNTQLARHGDWIYEQRSTFLATFLTTATGFYEKIAGTTDAVTLQYESKLQEAPLINLLEATQQKDMVLQRTTAGIHRDDVVIKMGDAPFKNEASQGQRKSLLFALKLAEWEAIKANKGFAPILLLDDIFEKLDAQRMHNLLQWVCTGEGQVFITDTHADRIAQQLNGIGVAYQLLTLS